MYLTTDRNDFQSRCSERDSFESLAELALSELSKFPGDVEIVCGPITSDGKDFIERNLVIFDSSITRLLGQRRPVFNQMPYEEKLFALRDAWRREEGGSSAKGLGPVFELFYRPLFMSGRFTKAWFLPRWKTSPGATWERTLLRSLGVEFVDLDEDWVTAALSGKT